jgi:hypothetical protein
MTDVDQANQALQRLLQGAGMKPPLFPPNSRYANIDTAALITATEKAVLFLRRRFVPPPESFALLQLHVVTQGERLDQVAAQYLGDPLAFWRIADANAAMRPEELTETPGRPLRITLPEGIPGTLHA